MIATRGRTATPTQAPQAAALLTGLAFLQNTAQNGAIAHIESIATEIVQHSATFTLGEDSLVSFTVAGVSVAIPAAFWAYLHMESWEINDAATLVDTYNAFVESLALEMCPAVADSSSLTYSYDQPPAGASVMLDPLATGVFVTGVLDYVNPDGETAAVTWGRWHGHTHAASEHPPRDGVA